MIYISKSSKIGKYEILIDELFINEESFLRYYHGDIPTRYFVSKTGKIYHELHDVFIKPGLTKKGYQRIGVYIGGKKAKPVTVHKMVAWTYHQDQWRPGYDVDHLDGIKTNNNADNLEWVSRKENIQRAYATGLKHGIGGESCSATKYSDKLIIDAFEYIKAGHTVSEASKKTDIPLSMMYILVRGDSRKYLWERYKFDRSIYTSHIEDYKLSIDQKIEIIDLYQQGIKPTDICNRLKISLEHIRTVYGWIYNHKNTKLDDIVLDKRLTTQTTIGDVLALK